MFLFVFDVVVANGSGSGWTIVRILGGDRLLLLFIMVASDNDNFIVAVR